MFEAILHFFRKPKKPTVYDFKKWLNTKDSNEVYRYWSSQCAFGQYLRDRNFVSNPIVNEKTWQKSPFYDAPEYPIPERLHPHLNSRTFGELKRKLENVR
jgi:hypothetical protein